MNEISKEVVDAVNSFVEKGQSFNSLDIYSVLGVRINDSDYPIYEQVWDLFKGRKMSSYLAEYVAINLECGGYAKVWRYYKPKADKKTFSASLTSDNRLELPKEAMGHFPLLFSEMGIEISEGKIVLKKKNKGHRLAISIAGRVRIATSHIKLSMLDSYSRIEISTYINRIEVVGINDI